MKKVNKQVALGGIILGVVGYAQLAFAVGPSTVGGVESSLGRSPQLQAPAPMPDELIAPQQTAKPQAANGPKIRVERIEITGNESIGDQELAAIAQVAPGSELTLGQIYEIADQVTAYYRKQGFPLATTNVPAQKISSGVIRLEVVEGKLEKFSFTGNSSYSAEVLSAHLSDAIPPGRVLTAREMERELLLLNDLPGLTARSVIKPGSAFGTSEVMVESVEKRFSGRLQVNNYGPENIGEWRGQGSLAVNNPLGIGDVLNVEYIRSEAGLLDFYNVGYSLPINTAGTRLAMSHSKVDFDIENLPLDPLDGESDTTRLQVTHPLIRSRKENFLVGVGLTHKDSETDALGSNLSEADLTMLDLSAVYAVIHPDRSASNIAAVFWTNFRDDGDGLDDGVLENRMLAKLRVDANHIRPITDDWNFFGRIAAVLSADQLVDSEKFSIGGPADIRAFPSSEVRGDQGFSLTLEAQHPFIAYKNTKGLFRTFWDLGKVHRKDPAVGTDATESLSAFGLGVTLVPLANVQVDLTWARPLNGRDVSDGEDSGRIWSNVTVSF